MTNTRTALIIIAVIVFIIIIIAIIIFFATRSGNIILPLPLFRLQRSSLTSGADTLTVPGNVLYLATPTGGATSTISLTIPASLNNNAGTVIKIKNESPSGVTNSSPITVIAGSGVTITTGGLPQPLIVPPGSVATFTAFSLNSYVRLN